MIETKQKRQTDLFNCTLYLFFDSIFSDTICTVIEKRLDDPTREDADDPLKAWIIASLNFYIF